MRVTPGIEPRSIMAQAAFDAYSVTVLGGVQDALAPLGGVAVLDPACAR